MPDELTPQDPHQPDEPERESDWFGRHWPQTWQVVVSLAGLLGVVHETLFASGDREALLAVFVAMMNLPLVLPRIGGRK
jgi:hypothetical protein